MALIAPSFSQLNMSQGTGFYYRRYAVFGKLKNVANICAELNEHAMLDASVEFSSSFSSKILLHQTMIEGQPILSRSPEGIPIGYIHPIPVKDSLPLFVLKNLDTNTYFLTTDPYASCGKTPFTNPYPVGHAKYSTYQNRQVYRVYDGKTQWISLLGFVMPTTKVTGNTSYRPLSDITGAVQFINGESLGLSELSTIL